MHRGTATGLECLLLMTVLSGCGDETAPADSPAPIAEAQLAEAVSPAMIAEQKRVEQLTSGWRAKAYRAAMDPTLRTILTGLALAARQADQQGLNQLPLPVQQSAERSLQWSGRLLNKQYPVDAQVDWASVASDFDAMAIQPPASLRMEIAFGFLMGGAFEMALVEIERVDPASIGGEKALAGFHLLRGVIYTTNRLPLLAVQDMTQPGVQTHVGEWGPEIEAGLHVLVGLLYLSEKDHRNADLQLMRAVKACPDGPLAQWLTGELLAADGSWEKAAESIATVHLGTDQEPLADMLIQRARRIRDAEGDAEPLVHDPTFVRELTWFYVKLAAERSVEAMRFRDATEWWRNQSQRIEDSIGGWHQSESKGTK